MERDDNKKGKKKGRIMQERMGYGYSYRGERSGSGRRRRRRKGRRENGGGGKEGSLEGKQVGRTDGNSRSPYVCVFPIDDDSGLRAEGGAGGQGRTIEGRNDW